VVDLTLRSQNFEGDHAILEQLLPILAQANPFTVWRVWLEGRLAPPQTVDLVTALLAHPPHYLNRFFNAFSPRARMFSVQVRTAHSR
jgi:hypothetical protein